MAAVRQGGISGSIGGAHKLFREEETQVINIGGTSLCHGIYTLFQVRASGHYIANTQAHLIGMAQDLGPVWFDSAAHEERDRVATMFETGHGLNSHHPALVRIETANLKEEEAAWITQAGNLAQSLNIFWVNRGEMTLWDAIGNNQRVDAIIPHLVLHVLANRTDR